MGEPANSDSDAHFDLSSGCLYPARRLGSGGKHRFAITGGSCSTLGRSQNVPVPWSWMG